MNLKCTAQMPETCWKKCPFVTRLTESNGTVQINESCDTMKLRFKSKQWWKWNREAIMKWKIWNNDVAGMEWNNAALILLASFLMKTLLMWIDCSKLSFNESDEPSVQLWWCETVAVSCDLMKALKAWCSCDDEWLWSGEDMKAIMTQNCEATKLRQLKVKKSNAASINLALTVKLCFCENCHCVTLWSCNSIKALKLPVWLSCDERKLWSFHSSKTMTTWIDWALMQSCHQSAKVLMTQSQFLQFWSKLNNFSNEFETNRKHDLHSIFQKLHQSNQCENKISNCFCSLVRWMLRVGTVWNMCCSNLSLTTLIENNLITETFSSNSDNLTKWCGTTVFLKTRFNPCKGNSTDKSQLQAFGFFGHTNQCANSSCWIPQHLNPFSQGQQFSVIVIRFWYGKPIPTHKVVTDVEQHVLCLPKWCKKGSAVETEQRTLSPVPKSSTLEPIPMSSSAQSLFVVWWDSHKCHSWSCSCCWKTDECCFLIRSEKCKNAKQKCIGFNKKGSQVCVGNNWHDELLKKIHFELAAHVFWAMQWKWIHFLIGGGQKSLITESIAWTKNNAWITMSDVDQSHHSVPLIVDDPHCAFWLHPNSERPAVLLAPGQLPTSQKIINSWQSQQNRHIGVLRRLVAAAVFVKLSWILGCIFRFGVPSWGKEEEHSMFWKVLFSCSFSVFSCSFWKCQNKHLIWGKLKE